ncbi:hypothetical protein [Luteococcus sp. OSA5]|uniref:hypothetical protein n=1 Tax=Luteococcus sp. OSA5 TaxID=3401630 RepID=UPI003B437900
MSTDDLGNAETMRDDLDRDLDGLEDLESLEESADANRPYGEVTAQDLGTQDLVDDGADLARSLDDDEQIAHRADAVVPVDEAVTVDDMAHQESIEERIQQEIPDEASDIVPPDAGNRF